MCFPLNPLRGKGKPEAILNRRRLYRNIVDRETKRVTGLAMDGEKIEIDSGKLISGYGEAVSVILALRFIRSNWDQFFAWAHADDDPFVPEYVACLISPATFEITHSIGEASVASLGAQALLAMFTASHWEQFKTSLHACGIDPAPCRQWLDHLHQQQRFLLPRKSQS